MFIAWASSSFPEYQSRRLKYTHRRTPFCVQLRLWGILIISVSLTVFIIMAYMPRKKNNSADTKFSIPKYLNISQAKMEPDTPVASTNKIEHRSETRLTDALVIGVSKCGSGALMFFLELNPNVKTIPSEIGFMCDEEQFSKGIEHYLEQLPKTNSTKSSQVVVERDGTCWRKHYAKRVYETYQKLNKKLKIIMIACNPIYRSASWFAHGQAKATKVYGNKTYDEIALNHLGQVNTNWDGIRAATYDTGFRLWLNYFDRKDIHIVNGDVFKTDPLTELVKLETFLGVEHTITSKQLYLNESRGFYCRVTGKGNTECMRPGKGRKHPYIKSETIKKLQEYFQEHNAEFEKLTGQTFEWKFEKEKFSPSADYPSENNLYNN